MLKIFAYVPENTVPYKCGERVMACVIDGGRLEKCVEFFKTVEEAKTWQRENSEYIFKREELH